MEQQRLEDNQQQSSNLAGSEQESGRDASKERERGTVLVDPTEKTENQIGKEGNKQIKSSVLIATLNGWTKRGSTTSRGRNMIRGQSGK